MEQFQFPLSFVHKFNLYKRSGLLIPDEDLASLARVYGVHQEELRQIEARFLRNIAGLSAALPQAQRAPADPPLSILAVGDSITSDRESWVKILGHCWRQDPSRSIVDAAVSGDTSADLLKRLYPTVLNREFNWAILFIGTNDSFQLDDGQRMSIISVEEFKRNIRFLSRTLLAAGKKLVQITIPPVDNRRVRAFFTESNSIYTAERIGAANEFIRSWAAQNGYAVADLARAIEKQGEDVLESDGLHLNARGQRLICELLLQILP